MADAEKAKVFCVGFHKTGTSSMGVLLERLGYRVQGAYRESEDDVELHLEDHHGEEKRLTPLAPIRRKEFERVEKGASQGATVERRAARRAAPGPARSLRSAWVPSSLELDDPLLQGNRAP